MAVNESDITINVIGRGDVSFADFSKSRGQLNADGTFENEDMHRVLGRFSEDYPYQTLGNVELTNGGKTLCLTAWTCAPTTARTCALP